MIDFHTHVLPGIDDGSADIDETAALLEEEGKQGVAWVVATPHFYAQEVSVKRFLARRGEALSQTRALLSGRPDLPKLRWGAEVYYFPGIGGADQIDRLCVNDTKVLLLEMPFEQWDGQVQKDVEQLIRRQGLTIVLAHVERYVQFQKDAHIFQQVLALPVIVQLNAGSLQKRRGGLFHRDHRQRFCLDCLRDRANVILGSDCHNMQVRRPNLQAGRRVISDQLGQEVLDRTDQVAARLLQV